MDVADRELERMVERRSRNGEVDPDEQEELWKASVRTYHAQRDAEVREQWRSFHHRRMAVLHTDLARGHEEKAALLARESVL